jgi:hypothetical protein
MVASEDVANIIMVLKLGVMLIDFVCPQQTDYIPGTMQKLDPHKNVGDDFK